jgi:hypothetical protein
MGLVNESIICLTVVVEIATPNHAGEFFTDDFSNQLKKPGCIIQAFFVWLKKRNIECLGRMRFMLTLTGLGLRDNPAILDLTYRPQTSITA